MVGHYPKQADFRTIQPDSTDATNMLCVTNHNETSLYPERPNNVITVSDKTWDKLHAVEKPEARTVKSEKERQKEKRRRALAKRARIRNR